MEYKATFSIVGRVTAIGETQVFGRGFRVRKVMLETSPGESKYANPVEVRLTGDRVDYADSIAVGQDVECSGFCDGRYADGKDGKQHYFFSLSAMRLKPAEGASAPTTETAPAESDNTTLPDEMPF